MHSDNSKRYREKLDELYSDLDPKDRRDFFEKMYSRMIRWSQAVDDDKNCDPGQKIRTLKVVVECLEKLAILQEKADKRDAPARKLVAALLNEENRSTEAIGALKAALDAAMEQGDYKVVGALATQYLTAIGAIAPAPDTAATPAKAREHMRSLFGGVTPTDASDTPEDKDPGKA